MNNPTADLGNINAHTKLGENPSIFTKISFRNETADISRADKSVKNWQILPINNPKPDLTISMYIHWVLWKSIDIYSSYHLEMKIRTEGRTDGQPMWYLNTPHYRVEGIKKGYDLNGRLFIKISPGLADRDPPPPHTHTHTFI